MIANRITSVFLAATFVAVSGSGAFARDRWPDHGGGQGGFHSPHHGQGQFGKRNRLKWLSDQNLGGASRVTSETGTRRSGTASVTNLTSVGIAVGSSIIYSDGFREIYIDPYGDGTRAADLRAISPRAKVIDVNEAMADGAFNPINGCSFEMGVCVIRGGS